jgi:hypothetical protein
VPEARFSLGGPKTSRGRRDARNEKKRRVAEPGRKTGWTTAKRFTLDKNLVKAQAIVLYSMSYY